MEHFGFPNRHHLHCYILLEGSHVDIIWSSNWQSSTCYCWLPIRYEYHAPYIPSLWSRDGNIQGHWRHSDRFVSHHRWRGDNILAVYSNYFGVFNRHYKGVHGRKIIHFQRQQKGVVSRINIYINHRKLMVNIIKYSSIRGNKKTADRRSKKEVKRRIVLAKSAFHEMSRVLKSRNTVKFRK